MPKSTKDFFTKAIYNVWLPSAIRYGIDIHTFWSLNPRIMYAYQDAYIEQKKEEIRLLDASAYMNGMYNIRAIMAALNGKKSPYPEKPALTDKQGKKLEEDRELTEEEKLQYQKQLLMQLQIMQSNFETGKKESKK